MTYDQDGRAIIDDPELARQITEIGRILTRDGAISGSLISDRAAVWMRDHCWNCRRRKLACRCIFP